TETLAHVTVVGLEVRGSGGPALVALEDGVLRADALTVRDNAAGLVMADCQGTTGVKLGRVRGQGPAQGAAGPEVRCVVRDSP
ncbi:MAG: right-handed parallel beta-helix repeat-containing protein, partial [Archangium sp.]